MTRDNAAKLWPIVKAYAEGKKIQVYTRVAVNHPMMCWIDEDNPAFSLAADSYRIKPEPREFYVPSQVIYTYCGGNEYCGIDRVKVREVLE